MSKSHSLAPSNFNKISKAHSRLITCISEVTGAGYPPDTISGILAGLMGVQQAVADLIQDTEKREGKVMSPRVSLDDPRTPEQQAEDAARGIT